jgi:hypothetical protein
MGPQRGVSHEKAGILQAEKRQMAGQSRLMKGMGTYCNMRSVTGGTWL